MNLYLIARYLDYVAALFVLLPLFYLIKKKENFERTLLKVLGILLLIGGLTDLASYITYSIEKTSNIAIANIEFVIEFFLISYLFVLACPKMKKLAITVSFVFLLLFITTCLVWQPIGSYQNITRITAALIFITYSILYFRYLIKELPAEVITHYTPFWIIVAIFFYFTLTLYLFILSRYVFTHLSPHDSLIFWMSRYASEIIKDILFTVGVYYGTREKY